MKKLLLVFMSMFFVLGTSMAQDDKTDPASFELLNVSPADGAKVSTVYNIRLEFSKDVAVTLPESGIDVVNSETKEVVKITRVYEDEWAPKNNVMLMFEQKMVPGKDGKEELQDQYIETPGAYTYTIPAGCIKSVDGEEFAERTFTFTIVGTFSYASYSPVTTDTLEKIEVTFDKEITEVKMPNSGLSVVDLYWTPVANVINTVVSDDKKTVTLELDKAITEQGQYALDLYQGVFVSADGISQYSTLMFNVVDSNPSFSFNYEDGSKVQELGNLEITFSNVKEVKLMENGPKVTAYLPGGSDVEGTAALADNKITVTFEQQFTEEGEYVFQVPAGMFTMDGVANEERLLTLTLYTFTITPLEVVSVTPEVGAVDQIEKIIVKFNQPVGLYYNDEGQTLSSSIKLTCGDKEYVLSSDYSNDMTSLTYTTDEWTGTGWKSNPIKEAGTYSLDLSSIVVFYAGEDGVDQWGYPVTIWNAYGSVEGTCTWTISGDNAIKVVAPEAGEQVIYDLLGRRIEKIAGAGIYIVNGKKVVIK